jgi:hypothetical protein
MPVRARQGPKLVVCAKTHDSGDSEVRPNADHENFCHMQRLIQANRGSKTRQVEAMLRDLEKRAAELEG